MGSGYHTPESKERTKLMDRMRHAHGALDRIRCDPMVCDADLDIFMDDALRALDVVMARLPLIPREYARAA